jgi:CubicO group peptidase (beta-lactamase class C family)
VQRLLLLAVISQPAYAIGFTTIDPNTVFSLAVGAAFAALLMAQKPLVKHAALVVGLIVIFIHPRSARSNGVGFRPCRHIATGRSFDDVGRQEASGQRSLHHLVGLANSRPQSLPSRSALRQSGRGTMHRFRRPRDRTISRNISRSETVPSCSTGPWKIAQRKGDPSAAHRIFDNSGITTRQGGTLQGTTAGPPGDAELTPKEADMSKWLGPALDYLSQWLEYQMREREQPGCVIAVVHECKVVFEQAFGHADLKKQAQLTPRHRFRVASHSKSFTASGIMKLREQGKLGLDDRVGQYVHGLHSAIAEATIAQVLSHTAGISRDGTDGGQWQDERAFLDEAQLRADLAAAPIIERNTRFKYSNHGYGLLGLVIEAVAGIPYRSWIRREIIEAAGLDETEPDMPLADAVPVAHGHSGKLPVGRRMVIPGDNSTNALAPATGFVSTARDLAHFFAQLDPAAKESVLSVASRREQIRAQWRDPHSSVERYYGLGISSGKTAEWKWFGHGGGFQGFITRTVTLPDHALAASLLTNAVDGAAGPWIDGVIHILASFAKNGAPTEKVRDWTGRWWSLWGAVDLVPMGEKVMIAAPSLPNPFVDAGEVSVLDEKSARLSLASGYGSHGESVRRVRGQGGQINEVWLGGVRLLTEAKAAAEMQKRYGS